MSEIPARIPWSDLRRVMPEPPPVSDDVRRANPGVFGPHPSFPMVVTPNDFHGDESAEKDLQRLCEHELSRRNVWFLHLSHRAREKVGCPDIIACVGNFAFACELKSASGRLTDDQKATLDLMASNGWRTFVCRSYQEFVEALNICAAKDAKS